jgi:uncharacterized membrane protein
VVSSRLSFTAIRSGILFGVGIAGIVFETVVHQAERPTLLILFAAMIGLPAFLGLDEARRNGKRNGS